MIHTKTDNKNIKTHRLELRLNENDYQIIEELKEDFRKKHVLNATTSEIVRESIRYLHSKLIKN